MTRILYVTEFAPENAGFGSELRNVQLLRALQDVGAVDIAVLHGGERAGKLAGKADGDLSTHYCLEVQPRQNDSLRKKIQWSIDPSFDFPFGCGVGDAADRDFSSVASSYDLVWFFKIRSPEMFRNRSWAHSVTDIDGLESTYESSKQKTVHGIGKRLSAQRRLVSWRRRERLLGERFTVLTVCSEEERRLLEEGNCAAPVHVIPNGFGTPLIEPVYAPSSPPRLGFIGMMDYFPNRDGVEWFVDQCWPLIKQRIPGVRLRLVGRNADGRFRSSDPQIDQLGWIEESGEEIATWTAMIVPLRVGAGTRIKIAHGFSSKSPIISTTFGAYGYGFESGRELFAADTAEDFAAACIRLIEHPEEAASMVERAWLQFIEKWSWEAIRPRVWSAAEECLRISSARAG